MKKSRLLSAVCAILFTLGSLHIHAAAVSGQGTWETTLLPRDLDGDNTTPEAYYDTVLNITWLADASAAAGSIYDDGDTTDGRMTWQNAMNWAANLSYYDNVRNTTYADWRLPNITPIDGASFDTNYSNDGSTDKGHNITGPSSELGYMYYITLGNPSAVNPDGSSSGCAVAPDFCLQNTGPFHNLQTYYYWTGVDNAYSDGSGLVWTLSYLSGNQHYVPGDSWDYIPWAVHDGDIGAAVIPLPPALWLFGSGLLGLIGVARRIKTANWSQRRC